MTNVNVNDPNEFSYPRGAALLTTLSILKDVRPSELKNTNRLFSHLHDELERLYSIENAIKSVLEDESENPIGELVAEISEVLEDLKTISNKVQ